MPQVFVLIRTKLQFWLYWLYKRRYRYFTQAFSSALSQEYENINIVLLQDCWWRLSKKPRRVRQPRFCKNIINNNRLITGREPNCSIYFYSCNNRGAAHSLFNVREILFRLGSNDDIAILLDDDDILSYSRAVNDIVDRMQDGGKAGVCISQFEIIGELNKSIVNRGGKRHNKLVEQGEMNGDLTSTMEEPYGKGSLCFADSLGWTKSYRIHVLKEYHDDLLNYFGTKRNLIRFLRSNNAFEDFPEIINLCRKDIRVVGLAKKTHAYRKVSGSVTSTPHRRDFAHKRPRNLALLMGLYKQLNAAKELKDGSDFVIARYFVVKILTIENILAKYRSDEQTHWSMTKFENGYFMRRLIDVLKVTNLLCDFIELLKTVNYLDFDGKKSCGMLSCAPNSPFKVLELTCKNEASRGRVDVGNLLYDKQIRMRVRKIKISYLKYATIICVGLSAIIFGYIWADGDSKIWAFVIPAIVSMLGGIYVIFDNDVSKRELQQRYSDRFCESVLELQRHVMAGLQVLLTILEKMDSGELTRPAKVHFANLKVYSQLLTNQWDDVLVLDDFGHLPNLRVNIRNINNSAKFMEEYVESDGYDPSIMKEIIDWEIVRYVGYITRFGFFAEKKSFSIPNTSALKIYVAYDDVLENMAWQMLPESDRKLIDSPGVDKKLKEGAEQSLKAKQEKLKGYFDRFIADRNEKRELIGERKV